MAFTEGNAGMHFELRPGTADGVMQTDMIIDSQKLTYVNQLPAWKRFAWPADTEAPGAALSWDKHAGRNPPVRRYPWRLGLDTSAR